MFYVIILFVAVLFGQGSAQPVPHQKDETSLVRIKADPTKFLNKEVVICGGISVSDLYFGSYREAKETHFCFEFTEVGATFNDVRRDTCYLYLSKEAGEAIVDALLTKAESNKGNNLKSLARVKVYLSKSRYAADESWDYLEVIDVQFCEKDIKSWMPWILENERKQAGDAKAAKQAALADAAKAKKAQFQNTQKAQSAAKWRTWTDTKGKKIKAQYSGINSGKVNLIAEDGTAFKLLLEDLPKEEQEWIKQKPWLKTEGEASKSAPSTKPKPAKKQGS